MNHRKNDWLITWITIVRMFMLVTKLLPSLYCIPSLPTYNRHLWFRFLQRFMAQGKLFLRILWYQLIDLILYRYQTIAMTTLNVLFLYLFPYPSSRFLISKDQYHSNDVLLIIVFTFYLYRLFIYNRYLYILSPSPI